MENKNVPNHQPAIVSRLVHPSYNSSYFSGLSWIKLKKQGYNRLGCYQVLYGVMLPALMCIMSILRLTHTHLEYLLYVAIY